MGLLAEPPEERPGHQHGAGDEPECRFESPGEMSGEPKSQRPDAVPGAVNVPLGELEARLSTLDPAQEVIAYCRGPYCVMSFEAVARLRQRGFSARRLQDGMPEWAAAGQPVES